jgi:hypothetical protein
MLTGRVWDACEAMESLPQNNFQVTCKIMQREEGLVLDAVQEIEEVLYYAKVMTFLLWKLVTSPAT